MNDKKIIIVDDHKIFREGIELIIGSFDFVKTVYHASNGEEFLSMVELFNPDLALMDINMPVMDGIMATKKSKERFPEVKIIALSMQENIQYHKEMIDAGADGYILKDTDSDELKFALSRILFSNENYYSQKLLQEIVASKKSVSSKNYDLSEREMEVLTLLCKGLSSREIGEELFLSARTIERHRSNLLSKTQTHNTIDLIIRSIKNGIIEP